MNRDRECSLCRRWPRVNGEFGDDYCAFHQRVMRWWSDSYTTDYFACMGQPVRAFLSGLRDKVRSMTIAETLYAIRYGGPFDFWPWENVTRFICRVRDHEPTAIGEALDPIDGEHTYLYRCDRCNGSAVLVAGHASRAAFREGVSYNSIYCGFKRIEAIR